ncbi:hypothetical protein [Ottowia testudinis]|uniref:Uncharacterized protein n=1 Tax=Ottowia testudinis TaxID=2816950 RepID=A0A975CJU1_9BURK|nr:hypothetical protein [Ottowia testudinis]QTD46914.1 hypothetical protein J1M35_08615 [Ottowia testudinis]
MKLASSAYPESASSYALMSKLSDVFFCVLRESLASFAFLCASLGTIAPLLARMLQFHPRPASFETPLGEP